MQAESMRQRMLSGDVRRVTLSIAAPSVAAMLATALGTLLDALVLSGDAPACAAVSACLPLTALMQTIGFTLGMGAAGFVSRSLGAGGQQRAGKAASLALCTALALSVAVGAAGCFGAAWLLRILGASQEALAPGVPYARYVLGSGPLLCAGLVLSSLLRAQGRTVPNMVAYGVGALVGALCVLALCRGLSMGVHGVGIAMFAREGVTLLLLIRAIRRGCAVRPSLRLRALKPALFGELARFGVPTLVRQGVTSLSGAMLSRTAATLGQSALGGMGLAVRAATLASSAVIGFGQGFQPVCGFCLGANEPERAQAAYRFCLRVVMGSMVAVGVCAFMGASPLLRWMGTDAEAAAFGARALRAQALAFWAMGGTILANMRAQAAGQTVRATVTAVSRQGIFFLPLLYLLPRIWGELGLILCQPLSDVLSLGLCLYLVRGAKEGEKR